MTEELVSCTSGNLTLEVAPALGSSITRFAYERAGGALDLLRPAPVTDLSKVPPTDTACFPLVPFSNRIRNGKFTFQGREVELSPNFPPEPHAIHGQGWHSSWEVAEHSDTSVRTFYEHEAADWPWSYRAEQHYVLTPDALEVTISIANTSNEAMPAAVGLHPYFVRTPRSRLATSVEKVWLSDDDYMPTELVEVPDNWDLTDLNPDNVSLDHNFAGWSRRAVIEWADRGARLSLTASEPLDFLVVFTPPEEAFFCVEPVSNALDAFNLTSQGRDDVGGSILESGETLSAKVTFAPEVDA
ncbi:MAG: aldose 1-epimerase [Actinomycetota bacterium]|nr:aldose 1-epimerase [Actinomycetota bacterium]